MRQSSLSIPHEPLKIFRRLGRESLQTTGTSVTR
jgi:hypothetical protein